MPEIDLRFMNTERWGQIKNTVKKQYPSAEEGVEDLLVDTAEGQVKQGEAEFVIFESPLGRLKLQFQKKPRVEEKKYHFSHRQGAAARVEYKFSEHELVYLLKAYKWDDMEDEWKEIDSNKISNF